MRKKVVKEDYIECCDFCGTELCEKCHYPADHFPEPDWQGMSDCSSWRCESLCCCPEAFKQRERQNLERKLKRLQEDLEALETHYRVRKPKLEEQVRNIEALLKEVL